MSAPLSARWGFIFLHCPLPLDEEQRLELVRLAAHAYLHDLPEIAIELPELRGVVRPCSDAVLVGSFYGQRFTAEVHLPDRDGQVSFLVAEAALRAAGPVAAEA